MPFLFSYSKMWSEKKLYNLPSYIIFHVCDLFLYVNVNVNMYFEAVVAIT